MSSLSACGSWGIVHADPFNLAEPDCIKNPVLTRSNVTDTKARFVADPFMISTDNICYMFFEILNHHSEQEISDWLQARMVIIGNMTELFWMSLSIWAILAYLNTIMSSMKEYLYRGIKMFRGEKSAAKTKKPLRILSNVLTRMKALSHHKYPNLMHWLEGKGHWHEKMLKMEALIGNLHGKKVLDLET